MGIFNDRVLEDHRLLSSYGIQQGSTLHLVLKHAMKICVQCSLDRHHRLHGKTIDLECYTFHTIWDIKAEIQNVLGNPPEQQYLIFRGKQLEDARTLSFYMIPNGSKLVLGLKRIYMV